MNRSQEREQDRSQPRSHAQHVVPGRVHERATSCQGSIVYDPTASWRVGAYGSAFFTAGPFLFLLCYPGFGLQQVTVPG